MLLHFERQLRWVAVHFVLEFESVVDFRQRLFVRKFHVHYGTDDLNDVSFIHKSLLATERHLRRGNLEQLGRDTGLTHLVVFEGKILDKLIRVIGGVLHRHHPRAVLGRARVEDHLENLVGNIIRKHHVENSSLHSAQKYNRASDRRLPQRPRLIPRASSANQNC